MEYGMCFLDWEALLMSGACGHKLEAPVTSLLALIVVSDSVCFLVKMESHNDSC